MSGTPRQRVSVSLTLEEIRATQLAIQAYVERQVAAGGQEPAAMRGVRERLRRAAQIVIDLEGRE